MPKAKRTARTQVATGLVAEADGTAADLQPSPLPVYELDRQLLSHHGLNSEGLRITKSSMDCVENSDGSGFVVTHTIAVCKHA